MMPDLPHPDPALGAVLHGVRALILDADGVLVLKGRSLPGAGEALLELARRDIPYRIVTNYSSAHRDTLAERFWLDIFQELLNPLFGIFRRDKRIKHVGDHLTDRSLFAGLHRPVMNCGFHIFPRIISTLRP